MSDTPAKDDHGFVDKAKELAGKAGQKIEPIAKNLAEAGGKSVEAVKDAFKEAPGELSVSISRFHISSILAAMQADMRRAASAIASTTKW